MSQGPIDVHVDSPRRICGCGSPSWLPARNRPATATGPEAIVGRGMGTRDRTVASSRSDRLDRDSPSDQAVTPAGQQFADVSTGRDEHPLAEQDRPQSLQRQEPCVRRRDLGASICSARDPESSPRSK